MTEAQKREYEENDIEARRRLREQYNKSVSEPYAMDKKANEIKSEVKKRLKRIKLKAQLKASKGVSKTMRGFLKATKRFDK